MNVTLAARTRCESMIRALAAALLFAFLPFPALAGTTGTVTGVVRSALDGRPMAGTHVQFSSPAFQGSTVTDARGFFSCVGIPAGVYTVSVVHAGYSPRRFAGFYVAAESAQRADFVLTRAFDDPAGPPRVPTLGQSTLRMNRSVTILSAHSVPNFDSLTFAQQLQFAPGLVP